MAAVGAIKSTGKGISKLGKHLEKPVIKTPRAIGRAFVSAVSAINEGTNRLLDAANLPSATKVDLGRLKKKSSPNPDVAELATVIETLISEKHLLAQKSATLERRLQALERLMQPTIEPGHNLKPEIRELKKELKDIIETLKT